MALSGLILVLALQDVPALPSPFRLEAAAVTATLTPDHGLLIALDQQGTVFGWRREPRKRLYVRRGFPVSRSPRRLTCSSDGRYVALSDHELQAEPIFVLRCSTGETVLRIERGCSPAFSPEGDQVACSDGQRVRRWSLKSGAELPALEEASVPLRHVVWSPAGDFIAAAARDADAVWFWTLPGRSARTWPSDPGKGPATSLAVAPDGDTLLLGTHWGARLLPATTVRQATNILEAEYSRGDLGFTADGSQIWSVDRQNNLLFWSRSTLGVDFTWSAAGLDSATRGVTTNGKYLLWMSGSGIRLERIPAILEGAWTGNVVTAVGFTAEGKAVIGGRNGLVQVWDPETEKELQRYEVPKRTLVQFANHGRWAVFGGDREPVLIRDLETGKDVLKVDPPSRVTALAVSPDAALLGLGLYDGSVRLWDVASRSEAIRIPTDAWSVTAIVWSPDGKTLAWGTSRGDVVMAEGRTGGDRVTYASRGSAVRSMEFERDGRRLLVHGAGSRLYTGEIGREPLPADWESLQRVAYPDLRWMESAMRKQPHTVRAFSADGRYAVTNGNDGAQIWKAPWE